MDKKNNSVIIILVLIIVILLVFLGLIMSGTISLNINSTGNNQTIKSNNEIEEDIKKDDVSYVGEYTYKNDSDLDVYYHATLDLLSNGTFYTKETETMTVYYYGTYEINNGTLKLNYQFEQANSQSSYNKLDITKEYTINSDNTITILKSEDVFGQRENMTLEKISDDCTIVTDFTNNFISLLMMEKENN